ncbi:MAG: hypothetical protein HOE26_08920 [Rhodospirillaceae bacterium]|jgi:hypothetical protein|nr:hypothetical protein [Rhodospirillaceae bacterium]
MKSFNEHQDDHLERECLEESTFRSASAFILFNRVHSHSKDVHRTKDIGKKLDAVASQNTNLAAMVFAMTQFQKNQK